MNIDICVVGTSNQLFTRGYYSETKFKKNSYWKNSVLCDRSIFYSPFLFVLTLASDRTVLYENVAFSILVLSTKKRYFRFLKIHEKGVEITEEKKKKSTTF